MSAKIVSVSAGKMKIELEISFDKSFQKTEDQIQDVLNEVGSLMSKESLKKYDTDGSPIEVNKQPMSSKGLVAKKYQTPHGEIEIERHVYQSHHGGKTYCPLEVNANILKNTTPRFAKMVSSKYSETNAERVRKDLKENHHREISKTFIQHISNTVGEFIVSKQEKWNYRLPAAIEEVETIGCGLDGTCLLISNEGYREAMVGTIAFYDKQCDRLNTIYLAGAPEYGKKDFIARYESELAKVKERYPHATYVGIADGARENWKFLDARTSVQVLDYYHASEYLTIVSESVFRNEEQRKTWLKASCHSLKHEADGAKLLLKEFEGFQKKKKLGKTKSANLQKAITYFSNNIKRMNYADYQSEHYPIGSGVTESACKVIVKQRLGNSGMKWKHQGAQNVLMLRAMNYSGSRWEQMWEKIDRYGFT